MDHVFPKEWQLPEQTQFVDAGLVLRLQADTQGGIVDPGRQAVHRLLDVRDSKAHP